MDDFLAVDSLFLLKLLEKLNLVDEVVVLLSNDIKFILEKFQSLIVCNCDIFLLDLNDGLRLTSSGYGLRWHGLLLHSLWSLLYGILDWCSLCRSGLCHNLSLGLRNLLDMSSWVTRSLYWWSWDNHNFLNDLYLRLLFLKSEDFSLLLGYGFSLLMYLALNLDHFLCIFVPLILYRLQILNDLLLMFSSKIFSLHKLVDFVVSGDD